MIVIKMKIVYGKIIAQPIQKAVEQLLLEKVRRPHLQIVFLIQTMLFILIPARTEVR